MSGHGSYRQWQDGCRCAACREAERVHFAIRQASNRRTLAPGDPRHGSWNGYANYACRCEPCRTAAKEYKG